MIGSDLIFITFKIKRCRSNFTQLLLVKKEWEWFNSYDRTWSKPHSIRYQSTHCGSGRDRMFSTYHFLQVANRLDVPVDNISEVTIWDNLNFSFPVKFSVGKWEIVQVMFSISCITANNSIKLIDLFVF